MLKLKIIYESDLPEKLLKHRKKIDCKQFRMQPDLF